MGVRVIHMIRHGRYYTDHDHPGYGALTSTGETQARYAAEVFADAVIHRLRASTMLRANQTASIIHPQIGQDVPRSNSHLLREVIPAATAEHVASYPSMRLLSTNERRALLDLEPSLRETFDDQFGAAMDTDVERERAMRAGNLLFKPNNKDGEMHEIVVSHGNLIRFLVCGVLGAPPETWLNMNIHHCSITRFVVADGGDVILDSFNETMHLPAEYVTLT